MFSPMTVATPNTTPQFNAGHTGYLTSPYDSGYPYAGVTLTHQQIRVAAYTDAFGMAERVTGNRAFATAIKTAMRLTVTDTTGAEGRPWRMGLAIFGG